MVDEKEKLTATTRILMGVPGTFLILGIAWMLLIWLPSGLREYGARCLNPETKTGENCPQTYYPRSSADSKYDYGYWAGFSSGYDSEWHDNSTNSPDYYDDYDNSSNDPDYDEGYADGYEGGYEEGHKKE